MVLLMMRELLAIIEELMELELRTLEESIVLDGVLLSKTWERLMVVFVTELLVMFEKRTELLIMELLLAYEFLMVAFARKLKLRDPSVMVEYSAAVAFMDEDALVLLVSVELRMVLALMLELMSRLELMILLALIVELILTLSVIVLLYTVEFSALRFRAVLLRICDDLITEAFV